LLTRAAEVIFGALLLAWLLLIPQHPAVAAGTLGATYLHVSPFSRCPAVLGLFYWCVVAVECAPVDVGECLESVARIMATAAAWQQIA